METGPISGEVLSVVLEPSLQVCFGYPLVSSYTAVTRACTHTCKRYCPELDLSGGGSVPGMAFISRLALSQA